MQVSHWEVAAGGTSSGATGSPPMCPPLRITRPYWPQSCLKHSLRLFAYSSVTCQMQNAALAQPPRKKSDPPSWPHFRIARQTASIPHGFAVSRRQRRRHLDDAVAAHAYVGDHARRTGPVVHRGVPDQHVRRSALCGRGGQPPEHQARPHPSRVLHRRSPCVVVQRPAATGVARSTGNGCQDCHNSRRGDVGAGSLTPGRASCGSLR